MELPCQGGVGLVAKEVMSLGWVKRKPVGGDKRVLSDQLRRAVSCAIVRGNADAFARFNEPVRARFRAREALQVEERVVRWIGEQGEDGVPAAAPEVGAGAERDVGAGAEADVVSDASSATGGMY